MNERHLLEVIACSVEDAIEAEAGGAGRIELVRELERGGMTPDLSLVREVLRAVSIPVRVMVRESESHEVSDDAIKSRLLEAARILGSLPIDGLVLGFLRGGRLDLEFTGEMLACAPRLKVTFHRAFEDAEDPFRTINDLKTMTQVDRILTGGGAERLRDLSRWARPEIEILAGSGVDGPAIGRLLQAGVREFHVGRAAREPAEVHGRVTRERVAELRNWIYRPIN